jgi:hypothetical protein
LDVEGFVEPGGLRWTSSGGWAPETPISHKAGYSVAQSATCSGSGFLAATQVTMTEPDGTSDHSVPDQRMVPTCFNPILNGVVYADDGSGWMLRVDPNSGTPNYNGYQFDLSSIDGTEITSTYNNATLAFTNVLTDPKGNQITSTIPGAAGSSHYPRRTYDLHPDVAGQKTVVKLYVGYD